jgi:hypothetical protein
MRARLALRWIGPALAIGLHGLLTASSCLAGPLVQFDFSPGSPVIFSVNGTLSYDATTGAFHSEMTPLTYAAPSVPGGFAFFTGGTTTIDLVVDTNGDFVTSGDGVVVTGSLDLDGDGTDDVAGDAADPLLFGPVVAFGAEPPGPPTRTFDGLFTVQGGALTGTIPLSGGGALFGGFPIGPPGGFVLSAEDVGGGILGDFKVDFSSSNVKSDISGVVPEPGGLTLALAALAVVVVAGRLRRGGPGARSS